MHLITRDVEFRLDTREDSEADGRTISGYAAVFDQDTEINSFEGKFTERIARGAFKKTLKERKPIMQYDHGRDSRVGSVPIGKYTAIREDEHGLFTEGRLFDNNLVEPVRQAIEGGAISGQSFKFRVVRDEWRKDGKLIKGDALRKMLWEGVEGLVRTIKEVQLFEAGPVSTPAYSGTSVGVRSAEELNDDQRDVLFEDYTRSMVEPRDEDGESRSAHENHVHFHVTDIDEALRAAKKANPFAKSGDDEDEEEDDEKETPEKGGKPSDAKPEDKPDEDEDEEEPASDKKTPPKKRDAAVDSTSRTGDTPEQDAAPKGTSRRDSISNPVKRTRAMTLSELKERLAVIDVRREELATEYRDAEMPEAEEREYDELKTERAKVEKTIEKIEARMAELASASGSGATERAFGAPAVHIKKDYNDLDVVTAARGDELTDLAKRSIDEARMGGRGLVSQEDAQSSALNSLMDYDDEQGTLAKRMLVTGNPVYERAWAKVIGSGNPQVVFGEEARTLVLGTDNKGGFAVPYQLDPTVILTTNAVVDPLRSISRQERIVGKTWQGITSDGTSVTRSAEATEVALNDMTLEQPEVDTIRVTGYMKFSYELAATWSALRGEITRALMDAKAREEANAFVNDDASTALKANGLLGTMPAGSIVATPEDTLTAAEIYGLEDALDDRYLGNARFLANRAFYNRVRQFANADGHDLWERIGAGRPAELLGYQAITSTAMSNALTNGNKLLVLGDFSNFLIVDRIGMSMELIPQVFGANQRPTAQRGILAVWWNNSKILVPDAFRVLQYTNAA